LQFNTFYADSELDPNHGTYQRIIERFDPEVNNAVLFVYLLEQAVGSGPVPKAYLCCTLSQQQVKIYCICLPSKFMSSFTGEVTPWDGGIFAFLGKVSQGMVTMVQLPTTIFCTVNNVQAKSSEYMVTNLAELTLQGLPLCQEDDEDASNHVPSTTIRIPPPKSSRVHHLLSVGNTLSRYCRCRRSCSLRYSD
jgi:hypothetical protein